MTLPATIAGYAQADALVRELSERIEARYGDTLTHRLQCRWNTDGLLVWWDCKMGIAPLLIQRIPGESMPLRTGVSLAAAARVLNLLWIYPDLQQRIFPQGYIRTTLWDVSYPALELALDMQAARTSSDVFLCPTETCGHLIRAVPSREQFDRSESAFGFTGRRTASGWWIGVCTACCTPVQVDRFGLPRLVHMRV